MKPIIVFVLAFVGATAASTGAKVVMTKPAKTAVDSAHAVSPSDSAKAESATADSAAAKSATDTAVVASGQPVSAPAEAGAPASPAPVPTAGPASTPASTVGATPPKPEAAPGGDPQRVARLESAVAQAAAAAAAKDTAVQASERRIAKVFTSMDAKQAAKVLEHMTDGDIHVILGYVGVKQAAQIMAALPPERVAKISKLAMENK